MTEGRSRPRIVLAADHGGVALKEDLIRFLAGKGYAVRDLGTDTPDPVDYPDYGFAATAAIQRREADRAILICKSGIGMAIAANKARGMRAALVSTVPDAELARRHNDSNVLVLGANDVPPRRARSIVRTWLTTPFEGGRHRRRVEKIRRFEKAHWTK